MGGGSWGAVFNIQYHGGLTGYPSPKLAQHPSLKRGRGGENGRCGTMALQVFFSGEGR